MPARYRCMARCIQLLLARLDSQASPFSYTMSLLADSVKGRLLFAIPKKGTRSLFLSPIIILTKFNTPPCRPII
jgi:hypothetical protein